MSENTSPKTWKKSALPPARWGLIAITLLVIVGMFAGSRGAGL